MGLLSSVAVPQRPVARLEPLIGDERYRQLVRVAEKFRQQLAGRIVWSVNSTATGGGVAEMLQVLLGYVQDLDVTVRWMVIGGDADFFAITKRVHNQIHGEPAGGPLTPDDAAHYARIASANAAELLDHIRPGDIVLLHDPQTAGLVEPLTHAGARVVWRCHIGVDWDNEATLAGWGFLQPYLGAAERYVFTRRSYVPTWMPASKVAVIPPSIDPFAPKNQQLDPAVVRAILTTIGVLDAPPASVAPQFVRRDDTAGLVTGTAAITGEGLPGPDDPVVLQVSRWDRLKDMAGVMRGFAETVAPSGRGYLMLVGPAVAGVTDDPEGATVFADCVRQWRDLPAAVRARVLLVNLPLDDIDGNAVMVNALQRHATVIAQKSLAEGFGLTVAEGMWKARPVVGSAVGGIIDQIAEGTGVLLPDPRDTATFGTTIRRLLDDPAEADRMGQAAQTYIRDNYVGDLHLLRYADLLQPLL